MTTNVEIKLVSQHAGTQTMVYYRNRATGHETFCGEVLPNPEHPLTFVCHSECNLVIKEEHIAGEKDNG